jgi:hypothetical protein
VQRLFQGIEHEARTGGAADPPANDAAPSVPTMMRQLPPGSLDPKARKDHLAYAHAAHTK